MHKKSLKEISPAGKVSILLMNDTSKHDYYINQCITLGKEALQGGNPPVGAILVIHDKIIGSGKEAGKSSGDVTRHAEIEAIRNAIQQGYQANLSEATLYTTHEPCIMCAYVIRHHHIARMVYGLEAGEVGGHKGLYTPLATTQIKKWGESPEIISGIKKEVIQELQERFHTGI